MYGLDWTSTGYGNDFEAWMPISACGDISNFHIEPPDGWPLPGMEDTFAYDIWFKAYDTSFGENKEDIEAYEAGYLYNCLVMIRGNDCGILTDAVIPNPVALQTRADAIEYFEKIRNMLEAGDIDLAKMYERRLGT